MKYASLLIERWFRIGPAAKSVSGLRYPSTVIRIRAVLHDATYRPWYHLTSVDLSTHS